MATWEDVRRIAAALPNTEETTTHRNPCFKVRGKTFVNVSREPGAIATRASAEETELLIRAKPDVYFITPHYVGWNAVLARLDAIDEEELAGRLEDAWEFMSSKTKRRA
jgi:hypothetical protein